jgi:hypothetical protein
MVMPGARLHNIIELSGQEINLLTKIYSNTMGRTKRYCENETQILEKICEQ